MVDSGKNHSRPWIFLLNSAQEALDSIILHFGIIYSLNLFLAQSIVLVDRVIQ